MQKARISRYTRRRGRCACPWVDWRTPACSPSRRLTVSPASPVVALALEPLPASASTSSQQYRHPPLVQSPIGINPGSASCKREEGSGYVGPPISRQVSTYLVVGLLPLPTYLLGTYCIPAIDHPASSLHCHLPILPAQSISCRHHHHHHHRHPQRWARPSRSKKLARGPAQPRYVSNGPNPASPSVLSLPIFTHPTPRF